MVKISFLSPVFVVTQNILCYNKKSNWKENYCNSAVQREITLFSPLESETGLCFCLEVEDEEGRVDGSDVDFMFTTYFFASL